MENALVCLWLNFSIDDKVKSFNFGSCPFAKHILENSKLNSSVSLIGLFAYIYLLSK